MNDLKNLAIEINTNNVLDIYNFLIKKHFKFIDMSFKSHIESLKKSKYIVTFDNNCMIVDDIPKYIITSVYNVKNIISGTILLRKEKLKRLC